MDTRINIAVIVGVVFVLAFAVTLTQYENQAVSQDGDIEMTDDLIMHYVKNMIRLKTQSLLLAVPLRLLLLID